MTQRFLDITDDSDEEIIAYVHDFIKDLMWTNSGYDCRPVDDNFAQMILDVYTVSSGTGHYTEKQTMSFYQFILNCIISEHYGVSHDH